MRRKKKDAKWLEGQLAKGESLRDDRVCQGQYTVVSVSENLVQVFGVATLSLPISEKSFVMAGDRKTAIRLRGGHAT